MRLTLEVEEGSSTGLYGAARAKCSRIDLYRDAIGQSHLVAAPSAGDLSNRIGMDLSGDRVTLKIWRDHSRREVSVKLAKAQAESLPQPASGVVHGHPTVALLIERLAKGFRAGSTRLIHL